MGGSKQQAGGGGGRAMNKRVSGVDCPALLASRGRGRLGRLMWKGLFQAELNGDGLCLCHHSRNVAQQQRKAFVLSDQQQQCVASKLSLNPRFLGSRQACLRWVQIQIKLLSLRFDWGEHLQWEGISLQVRTVFVVYSSAKECSCFLMSRWWWDQFWKCCSLRTVAVCGTQVDMAGYTHLEFYTGVLVTLQCYTL